MSTHRPQWRSQHPPHLYIRRVHPALGRRDNVGHGGQGQRDGAAPAGALQAAHAEEQPVRGRATCTTSIGGGSADAAADVHDEGGEQSGPAALDVGQVSYEGGGYALDYLITKG